MGAIKAGTMPRAAQRTKSLAVELTGDGRVAFQLGLRDTSISPDGEETIHDLEIEGELLLPPLEIVRIEARAIYQPFAECAASLHPVAEMVGTRIGPGFRDRVLEVMGRVRGCTHLMTLMLDLTAAHTLSLFLRMREQSPYSDRSRDGGAWLRTGLALEPRLENACVALRSESAVIEKARRK